MPKLWFMRGTYVKLKLKRNICSVIHYYLPPILNGFFIENGLEWNHCVAFCSDGVLGGVATKLEPFVKALAGDALMVVLQ